MSKRSDTAQRWLQMGIELEGAWTRGTKEDLAAKVKGATAKRDGSVRFNDRVDAGEIVTRPHALLKGLQDETVLLYPDKVNETCGFHIHASFSVLDSALLTEPAFFDHFKDRWQAWGEEHDKAMGDSSAWFWARLKNKRPAGVTRNYCEMKNAAVAQLKDSNQDHRYTALNFSAWHKYKTVECRLLPMMPSAELAVDAIAELGSIYNDYLAQRKGLRLTMEKDVKEEGRFVLEEESIIMPDQTPYRFKRSTEVRPLSFDKDDYFAFDGVEGAMLPFSKPYEKEEI